MRAHHNFGGRPDGADFQIDRDPDALEMLRNELSPAPWTWLRQVHGAQVVVVTAPGEAAGTKADALVTAVPGATLAVHSADCAPVVLADVDAGVIGAAHAGWQGLRAGVLEATVEHMRGLGASHITAHIGPHIRVGCYEFGAADLASVAAIYGDSVQGATAAGAPALDVTAGVTIALERLGVDVVDLGGCTSCDADRYFSHRARGDRGRHAMTIVQTS